MDSPRFGERFAHHCPAHSSSCHSPEAESYLHAANPRLLALCERYALLRLPVVDHSVWTDSYVKAEVDLRAFRGDLAYVWQSRDGNSERNYFLTAHYIKDIDRLGLLSTLSEDNLFGIRTYRLDDGAVLSRDLTDSILEIYFLDKLLGISSHRATRILDVGAGYGRFAHRISQAFRNAVTVLCTDAIAESTFLSEFYLTFRRVDHQAKVIPLDELENVLHQQRIDVALNFHSFSECTLGAVRWWLNLLSSNGIQFLMIAPNPGRDNGASLLTYEKDGSRLDYTSELHARGYRLVTREPKYQNPVLQTHGVSPTTYYLFELG
jgi:SAM-dependent methyltransferase